MEKTSKIEAIKKVGHCFFVRHPKFRGEGTLFFRDGVFFYLPEFSSEIQMTEEEVLTILNN
jgi:hypothetical protein